MESAGSLGYKLVSFPSDWRVSHIHNGVGKELPAGIKTGRGRNVWFQ